NASWRGDVGIDGSDRRCFDGRWLAQIQRPHRGIEIVAEEIADGRGAKIPKVAPANRIKRSAVSTRLARAEPEIPVHARGSCFVWRPPSEALVPACGAGPGMDFSYIPDGPIPNNLASLPDKIARVSLVAHLRGHAGLPRDARDLASLPDIVRER